VDGNDQACASCGVGQQFLDERVEQETPPPPPPPAPPRALMTNVEPVATQAGAPQTEAKLQAPANYFRYRPRGHLAPSTSSGLMKRGANSGAGRGYW